MIIEEKFSHFSLEPYVVTPHLNSRLETVQIRGNNMFSCSIIKIIPNYHQLLSLI